MHSGPAEDPERVHEVPREPIKPAMPEPLPTPEPQLVKAAGWPFDVQEARRRQRAGGLWEKTIDLGGDVTLKLTRIPAGEFVMGSTGEEADEYPVTRVAVRHGFWMSACEITNGQFRRFDPDHDSGLFMKRSLDANGPGIDLNGPKQPVLRVSWKQAVAFCQWLSARTGMPFTLPTEAQWEYACRAGTTTDLSYGNVDHDFSGHANVADKAISPIYTVTGGVVVLQDIPSDTGFDDKAIVTAEVGIYQPNAWGLHDMHGNVAEWTRSTYRPYPYQDDNGRNALSFDGRKVVRGGSFYDRPKRCRSGFRLSYPAWQRVHNVGFRVVCTELDGLAVK
jgi:formylglycine-generating enzyme required for sulfatase activity